MMNLASAAQEETASTARQGPDAIRLPTQAPVANGLEPCHRQTTLRRNPHSAKQSAPSFNRASMRSDPAMSHAQRANLTEPSRFFGACFTIGFSSIASASTRARTWRAITPCRSSQPCLARQLLSAPGDGLVAAAARRARCFQRSGRPLLISWSWHARSAGKATDPSEAVEMLSLASLRCIRTVTMSGLGEKVFSFQ